MGNASKLVIPLIILSTTGCWTGASLFDSAALSRLVLTAEDAALLRASTVRLGAGRMIVADEAALASQLSKIRLVRSAGRNPLLYISGRSRPFGEILTREGRIRLLDYNYSFPIERNIFSVERKIVNVRSSPFANYNNNIITQLKEGSMVVKLGERNGWYQVQILEGSVVKNGWIHAALLSPLFLTSSGSSMLVDSSENKGQKHISQIRSFNGSNIFQQNEYLLSSISSFEIIDNEIRSVIELKNIDSSGKGLGLSFYAENSDGLADYWKFFPSPVGRVFDNYGNQYSISEANGLGYAKTISDWTILKNGESAFIDLVFLAPNGIYSGNNFSLTLWIRFTWRDHNNNQHNDKVLIKLSNIKL